MAECFEAEDENAAASIQSQPQNLPMAAECVAAFADQVKDGCAIMWQSGSQSNQSGF